MELSEVSEDEKLHLCSWYHSIHCCWGLSPSCPLPHHLNHQSHLTSTDLFEPFKYLDSTHNTAQTHASSKFSPHTASVFSLSSTPLPPSTTTFSPSHLESLPQRRWRDPLLLKVISLKQTSVHHYQQLHLHYCSSVSRHPLISSLSSSAAETVIHAFITSRIDYRSSILFSASSKVLNSSTSRTLLLAGRPPLHPNTTSPRPPERPLARLLFKVPLLTYPTNQPRPLLLWCHPPVPTTQDQAPNLGQRCPELPPPSGTPSSKLSDTAPTWPQEKVKCPPWKSLYKWNALLFYLLWSHLRHRQIYMFIDLYKIYKYLKSLMNTCVHQ